MNKYFLVVTLCCSILFFSACRSRQQANSQSTDSTQTTESATEMTTHVTIAGHLTELGLTPNSDWRGINVGDEFSNVKGLEKGESFESDTDHIGYTIELKNLESADILYYQTGKKVSAIDVDLFLNNRQSVTIYQKELEGYFSVRYGAPKPGDGGTVWIGQKGKTVLLKDVSKGKDFGLKIKIGSSGGAMTASVK